MRVDRLAENDHERSRPEASYGMRPTAEYTVRGPRMAPHHRSARAWILGGSLVTMKTKLADALTQSAGRQAAPRFCSVPPRP